MRLFSKTRRKSINLALQGGGAHGAFTWGVLDYLLEHVEFDIEAISGTSAGAMNAVVLADGYLAGEGRLDRRRYKKVRLHRIDGGGALIDAEVDASSKFNTSWAFLQHLKEIGQDTAKHWHRKNWSHVGKRSSVDLKEEIA